MRSAISPTTATSGGRPPWQTVYDYHARWACDGTVNRIHKTLREQVRTVEGRAVTASAAIIDSQSVRAAETVAQASRGYGAGKHVNGREPHIAVDTIGLLLVVAVSAASVQDRHASHALIWALRTRYQRISHVWADGGYNGTLVGFALMVTDHLIPDAGLQAAGQALTLRGREQPESATPEGTFTADGCPRPGGASKRAQPRQTATKSETSRRTLWCRSPLRPR